MEVLQSSNHDAKLSILQPSSNRAMECSILAMIVGEGWGEPLRSGADHCAVVLQTLVLAPPPGLKPYVPRSGATQHGQLRNAARSKGKNERNRRSRYLCIFTGGGARIREDSKPGAPQNCIIIIFAKGTPNSKGKCGSLAGKIKKYSQFCSAASFV
jgi:hypothetical protein